LNLERDGNAEKRPLSSFVEGAELAKAGVRRRESSIVAAQIRQSNEESESGRANVLKGHDFSRADPDAQYVPALAAEGCF
jgi:hypothetical protein